MFKEKILKYLKFLLFFKEKREKKKEKGGGKKEKKRKRGIRTRYMSRGGVGL